MVRTVIQADRQICRLPELIYAAGMEQPHTFYLQGAGGLFIHFRKGEDRKGDGGVKGRGNSKTVEQTKLQRLPADKIIPAKLKERKLLPRRRKQGE